jgi:hypothetical protein
LVNTPISYFLGAFSLHLSFSFFLACFLLLLFFRF